MSQEDAKRSYSERKRNILYLIYQYLNSMGYQNAAETIKQDAQLQPDYAICDNIDLDTMYLEYCSYYHMKFQKFPKIIRKIEGTPEVNVKNGRKLKSARAVLNSNPIPVARLENKQQTNIEKVPEDNTVPPLMFSLKVTNFAGEERTNQNVGDGLRVFAPLCDCPQYSPDWKEMAEVICRDIIQRDLKTSWKSIYGNSQAIAVIKEAVLLPLQQPALFSNGLKPWKSVLMHGPPGTGKTLIAKALCTEALGRVTFFRISPSTIISKWRGESEKILRVLFEVARYYAPSVIFFDEIEALTSRRDCATEHEASKRFKNEFLSLLDGIGEDNGDVFILATTNLPWEIDLAFLRRFEKKLLTDLPNTEGRKAMINSFLPAKLKCSAALLEKVAAVSVGFTGDEIRIACKEVGMQQVRVANTSQIGAKISISDESIVDAFKQISPLCAHTYQRYIDWNNTHGNKL